MTSATTAAFFSSETSHSTTTRTQCTRYLPVRQHETQVRRHPCREQLERPEREKAGRVEGRVEKQAEEEEGKDASDSTPHKIQRDLAGQFDVEESESEEEEYADASDGEPDGEWDWSSGARPWDDTSSVRTEDLLDAIGQPAVKHEEKLELRKVILNGGDRKTKLAAFMTTRHDRLTTKDKEEIGNASEEDQEGWRNLIRKHQTATGAMRQWREAWMKELASSSQGGPDESQSTQDSTWSPPQPPQKAEKRTRKATQMVRRARTNTVLNRLNPAVPLKKTKTTSPSDEDKVSPPDPRG